jgi:hypothetical protein
MRPYVENIHHKKGMVEWLKVKTLSSSPSTEKKTKNKNKRRIKADLGEFGGMMNP